MINFLLDQQGGYTKYLKGKYLGVISVHGVDNHRYLWVIFGNPGKTQFCMKENNMSSINLEMVKSIIPEPILSHKSRKLINEFPRFVNVEEM